MSNLTVTNNDLGSVILQDAKFRNELLTVLGAGTTLEGTLLARKSVADAIVAAADVGNTGNGTVTAVSVVAGPQIPLVGAYNLECISERVESGTATASAVADGGNTGNGTVTALTVEADKKGLAPGAYNLEMTALGTKNGTAVGSAGFVGTGNGTVSALGMGAVGEAGLYLITCINALVSGSEIFSVSTPEGVALDPLTVGVAYSNSHLSITILDGSTDFIVGDEWTVTVTDTGGLFKLEDPDGSTIANGIIMDAGELQATVIAVEGLNFTFTAGTTDFIVGDKFAVTVANATGLFKLEDPNGALVSNSLIMNAGASQATIIEIAGMTFTITDGAADFIVGDKFSLTVATDGKLVVFATAGLGGAQVPLAILTYAVVAAGAGDEAIRAGVSGSYRSERLVIDADGDASNITDAIRDQLRNYGLVPIDVQELNIQDNQ